MPKTTTGPGSGSSAPFVPDDDLLKLVNRLSCACAARAAHADAPLARAMFKGVEADGQSRKTAARALGIAAGDGAYLLAGLRRDIAVDLALALLASQPPRLNDASKRRNS